MASRLGLKVVASIEATKGLVVMAAGLGLFRLMHEDLQDAADRLVHNLHLNPASHYPQVLIDAITRLDNAHLQMLALGALAYSLVRFIESAGLWWERRWAEWFGALSGSIYLPLELFTLWERITWPRATLFCANAVVVGYLVYVLVKNRVNARAATA